MKTLAEFTANFLGIPIEDISDAIEAYKKHLQDDSPNTVHWAMIEEQLILALERMQSHIHLNGASHSNTNIEGARHNNQSEKPKSCNHEWVNRNDGHEEQCGAAICIRCGLYGCWCTAKWSKMTDEEKKAFKENGIDGNNHDLEKKIEN